MMLNVHNVPHGSLPRKHILNLVTVNFYICPDPTLQCTLNTKRS